MSKVLMQLGICYMSYVKSDRSQDVLIDDNMFLRKEDMLYLFLQPRLPRLYNFLLPTHGGSFL